METTPRSLIKGLFRPTFLFLRRAMSNLIERPFGMETEGEVTLEQLGLDGQNRKEYRPSEWLALRRILSAREVDDDDVFIDFGSGKGRVLFQAAKLPFKRVIGVELSEYLNAIARRNIARNRHRLRCRSIDIVTSDVLEYQIPDDITVAYFNDPFRGEIFVDVINRLLATLDKNPRRLRLIYRVPVEEEYLEQTGRFRLIRSVLGLRPGRKWADETSIRLYEALPTAEPLPVPSRLPGR